MPCPRTPCRLDSTAVPANPHDMDEPEITDALHEYLSPLSEAWTDAAGYFLAAVEPATLPPGINQDDILRKAQVQLQRNEMIDDTLMWEYMKTLQRMKLSVSAIYMDTFAFQHLLSSDKTQGEPKIRSLKPYVGHGPASHVFWPIHHGPDVHHWSLVHVNIPRRTVISYDSWSAIGGGFSRKARKSIYEYWVKYRVANPEDKGKWKHSASAWDQHSRVQAVPSNDCGILCLLLMRLLRANERPPELHEDEKMKEDIMRWVGGRMRYRMVAELLAGQTNPPDEAIPEWLKET
jgi:hypothetical protein